MTGLIALLLVIVATAGGFAWTRRYVRERLRFVDAVHRRTTPFVAGALAAVLATPLAWLLPFIGGGTVLLFAVAVGAGVAAGSRDVRRQDGGWLLKG
jgi:hypothetical protein